MKKLFMKMGEFYKNKTGDAIMITLAILLAVGIIVTIILLCVRVSPKTEEPEGTTTEPVTEETEKITTTEPVTEETTTEPKEDFTGQSISPLTGFYVPDAIAQMRPVAVMLNNIYDAVPQAGIANADIVYECPVEGGITRLMGIFQDIDDLGKIGSVRSCRLYYAHIALDYDAVYVHIGQSKYAVDFLESGQIDHLNAENYSGVAYRTSDRVSPHNAYVSGTGVLHGEDIRGYASGISDDYSGPLEFLPYNEIREEEGTQAVYVEPGFSYNNPYFEYNETTGEYLRYQFGGPQIDELTGAQLSYKNLIIQYVDAYYQDDEYTWDLDMTGSGYGKYITGGRMIDITWSRSSVYDTTVFYDEDGNVLKLNPGKTWITVMQQSSSSSLIVN